MSREEPALPVGTWLGQEVLHIAQNWLKSRQRSYLGVKVSIITPM